MRRNASRGLLALLLFMPVVPAIASHNDGIGDFNPSQFHEPLVIDNPFYPLEPGTQLVLEGSEIEAGETVARRLVVTVSDVVKTIHGVETLAISERDYVERKSSGRATFLREDELAFLAQDHRRNVWRFAEYPEEFDADLPGKDRFVGAPNTWRAGTGGAVPGLYMRGEPQPGTSDYSLVFAPQAGETGINDVATIIADNLEVCVAAGCFSDVIRIRERNGLVPDDCCQDKYHAPGVGNIQVEEVDSAGNRANEGEFLELVEVRRISRSERRQLNRDLLALDRRAYQTDVAADVWSGTARARLP